MRISLDPKMKWMLKIYTIPRDQKGTATCFASATEVKLEHIYN